MTERDPPNIMRSEEIDIALWNNKNGNGFPFLPNSILIECKNWSSQVGAPEITIFKDKLKSRDCKYGILIAANGITGDPHELTGAHNKISMALSEGVWILVIIVQELQSLKNTDDLVLLIKKKISKLVAKCTSID